MDLVLSQENFSQYAHVLRTHHNTIFMLQELPSGFVYNNQHIYVHIPEFLGGIKEEHTFEFVSMRKPESDWEQLQIGDQRNHHHQHCEA